MKETVDERAKRIAGELSSETKQLEYGEAVKLLESPRNRSQFHIQIYSPEQHSQEPKEL